MTITVEKQVVTKQVEQVELTLPYFAKDGDETFYITKDQTIIRIYQGKLTGDTFISFINKKSDGHADLLSDAMQATPITSDEYYELLNPLDKLLQQIADNSLK